jgi:hypothetical protein
MVGSLRDEYSNNIISARGWLDETFSDIHHVTVVVGYLVVCGFFDAYTCVAFYSHI